MIKLIGLKKKHIILSLCLLVVSTISQGQNTFYNTDSIQEIRITFEEGNWRHIMDSLFLNFGKEQQLVGTVSINGVEFQNAAVRYKGFSSYDESQTKNPFNIDLNKHINTQNYQGYTKVKLSNVIHDPSFVREALAYEIARDYMPASRANFAMVYVNDTLQGLYTNVEAVDDNFLQNHFGSNTNTFFKGSPVTLSYPFGQNSNLAYTHGDTAEGYIPYYKLESNDGWDDIFEMINILNNDTANIPTVINVDRALWMHAFNYSMINLDSYIGYSQNYYMYQDDNNIFNTIPWDLNMSFGSFRQSDGTMINLSIDQCKEINPLQHLYSMSFSPRPLMKNLFSNTTYQKMYLAHLRTIMNEQFASDEYYSRAITMQNTIDTYVQIDSNKFYSYADFISNLDTTTGPFSNQYPGIRNLMEARIAYLDTFPSMQGAPTISNNNSSPLRPAFGESCSITCKVHDASQVVLYYRYASDGPFESIEMFDDGAHNDATAGDSIFGAEIISATDIIDYYFWAENDSSGRFLPERAQYEFFTIYPAVRQSRMVINELYYGESWLEVLNLSSEDLKLDGLALTLTDETENTIFSFPDTMIDAHSYMIVWLDGDSLGQGLHSYEMLSKTGELKLKYQETTAIDSLVYGFQNDSLSFGSFPNGSQERVFLTPTMADMNHTHFWGGREYTLFPNPANDRIYIETKDYEGSTSLTIFNNGMQKVYSSENPFGNTSLSSAMTEIDVSVFIPGFYIIQIVNDNDVSALKFLIMR